MSAAGYSGLGTKSRKTEGFTLIEVIVAIAILSIISVALMQMFAVSSRSNGKTYALDKANALCTETAEHFKADPGFPGATDSGFTKAQSETGTVYYYRYLDRDFVYTEGPVPAGDSVYELDVTVTTTSAITTTAFYYPEAAYACTLQSSETNITLESTGSALAINVNGFGKLIDDPGKIIYRSGTSASTGASITAGDALIPIQVYCSSLATLSPKVKIKNKVKTVANPADGKDYTAVADIYLCDVPPETTITVEAEEGAVARQSSPVGTADSENIMYKAAIKITKLSDASILAENSAEKYWVN